MKTIKPYTNEFLKRQKERVNELTYKLMADPQYFKKESYIKEVERWVEVLEEYDEIVGVTLNAPIPELLALGAEKYSKALDEEYNNSKAQKYSALTLYSIFTLGLLPAK